MTNLPRAAGKGREAMWMCLQLQGAAWHKCKLHQPPLVAEVLLLQLACGPPGETQAANTLPVVQCLPLWDKPVL